MDFNDIKVMNIPTHNLRLQFLNNYRLLTSKEYDLLLSNWKPKQSIKTNYLTWYYWLDDFYTFIIQNSILGLESYIKGAAHFELGKRGKIIENIRFVKNPFLLKGENGTAAKYYKLLPSLVDMKFSLVNNYELWERTKIFYDKVRNPLFHGDKFDNLQYNSFKYLLEFLVEMYGWIDSWHNPEEIIKGSSYLTKIKLHE